MFDTAQTLTADGFAQRFSGVDGLAMMAGVVFAGCFSLGMVLVWIVAAAA